MFQDPFIDFNVRGFARLRASDLRRFKEKVYRKFSISAEMEELLVPDELFSARFETHSHVPGVAYLTLESVPLWFTLGKNTDDFVPTVYTLWKYPDLLPTLSIAGVKVPAMLHGKFLLDAKIRFQPSTSLSIGQLVCINHDYEAPRVGPPLAVGRMNFPSDLVKGGTRGRALTLLHAWKDQLWEIGGKAEPPRPRSLRERPNRKDNSDEKLTEEKAEVAMERKVVSNALRSALLESICVTLSKLPPESFPITASTFYETYILSYCSSRLRKPTDTLVDIKHSGFKSLTAFLKASTREGLIKTKKTKEGVVVTGVNRSHSSVRAHGHHVAINDTEAHKGKQEDVYGLGMGMDGFQEMCDELQVTFLRKPGPISATFFQCAGKNPEEFLTEKEIESIISQYLSSNDLFEPDDPESVNVARDEFLLDTVLDGKESDREKLMRKEFMRTDEVISRIVDSAELWYKISIDGQSIVGKGSPISVNITRRRNHTVTCVSGFEVFRLDAGRLAKGLNTACAASTAVQPDPRNPELKRIMVQGEQIKAVTERLIAGGIQRRWIEVVGDHGKWVGRTELVISSPRKKTRRRKRAETLMLGEIARRGICRETIKLNPTKGGKKRGAGKTRHDGKEQRAAKKRQDVKEGQDGKGRQADKKKQANKKQKAREKQQASEKQQSGNKQQADNRQQGEGKQQSAGGQRGGIKQQAGGKQQTGNKPQGGKKRQGGK